MGDLIAKAMAAKNASYLSQPIATYIHSANLEVVVSAVDVDTNTFTSTGHGLVDGDRIYPIPNFDAGLIYAIDKYPGGLTFATYQQYYVKKTDDNNFQISTTADLLTILDLTTNANMDLTKWHFEKFGGEPTAAIITGLPNLQRCRVLLRGKNIVKSTSKYVMVNGITVAANFCNSAVSGAFTYPSINAPGDVYVALEATFDYNNWLTLSVRGISASSKDTTTNTVAILNNIYTTPFYHNSVITSLALPSFFPANGTVVEVYRT